VKTKINQKQYILIGGGKKLSLAKNAGLGYS
jgi:hypothetical protein